MLFIVQLLPLLSAAASARDRTYIPRVINVFGAGKESSDMLLEDLPLEKPGSFSLSNWVKNVATMTTLAMRKLAEEPANRGVIMIHHFPGTVGTDLLTRKDSVQSSVLDNWLGRTLWTVAVKAVKLSATAPEEAGAKCLHLSTSAAHGGRGVPRTDGLDPVLTVSGTAAGSLYCVNENLEATQNNQVLLDLEKRQATDKVWTWTRKVFART